MCIYISCVEAIIQALLSWGLNDALCLMIEI